MMDRASAAAANSGFFEDIWRQGDYWKLASSPFERTKYARQAELLGARRYTRALEIGCGNGCFTEHLAFVTESVLALDIAPSAIRQAKAGLGGAEHVEFRVADVMQFDFSAEGPWDLVVMSETIYYLGWLHSFFDVSWLAVRIAAAMRPRSRLLMANTFGGVGDYLCRPWVIRTYHDLFRNAGFSVAAEEVFRGAKDGADIRVMMSLYTRTDECVEPELAS
jgi:2-polyprenyl-3-methyl-5-hydroxy-6-metoxy-1,4-benzoquinol methylase